MNSCSIDVIATPTLRLIHAARLRAAQPEGARFTVCTFDAHLDELRLAWQAPRGSALRGR